MKARSGRRRLFISLSIVLVLLVGGTMGILHFTSARKAADSGQMADGSDATAGTAPTGGPSGAVALASTDGQGTDSADAKAEENGDGKNGNGGKTPIPVSVAQIRSGSISSYITSTANLVPEDEVQILAEAEGRVAKLDVEEGDRVAGGQILVSLAKDDAEILLKKAELKATNARMAYERAVKMSSENLLSREEFDKITMDHEITRQELAEAQWKLEKTMIRAPFGGLITRRDVKLGQHVRPGDVLFTVSDFDPLIARIYLPEKDVLGLNEGRAVQITLKADETTRFRGRIRQISPVVDTATGTVKVTVEAVAPPAEVRPGAFVTIDIVRETRADATLLPREAIIRELRDAYVFVANGDVAEKRSVALGLEEAGRIEAIAGVDPGDDVIVAGQGGLKDGSPIKIIPTSEASDLGTLKDRPLRG